MKLILENWRKYCLISESKQLIAAKLEYPKVIASLFFEQFGNKAYLMARWMREYNHPRVEAHGEGWFARTFESNLGGGWHMMDLISLYEAALKGPEEYEKQREDLEMGRLENIDEVKEEIKKKLFNNNFFTLNTLIVAIFDGKLKNVSPYKKMKFHVANKKYEEEKLFEKQKAIVEYDNGFRWIDAGYRCGIVGRGMKNCGNVGVMSTDLDRTMLVLFKKKTPHVMVTYSRKKAKISGVEGQYHTKPKDKYLDYILDLANKLEAELELKGAGTGLLGIKYRLKEKTSDIQRLPSEGSFDEYFKVVMDNKVYYGTDRELMTEEDLMKVKEILINAQKNGKQIYGWDENKKEYTISEIVSAAFNHNNKSLLPRNLEITSTYKIAMESW